jgi:hypothetical protein
MDKRFLLNILDPFQQKITTTLVVIFMVSTFASGQTLNKKGKNIQNDATITIKNKSQDTLKAGAEYEMNVKVPLAYKHNFTISVMGATISGANGQYRLKTLRSSGTSVIITSANGRTLLAKKDYVVIK